MRHAHIPAFMLPLFLSLPPSPSDLSLSLPRGQAPGLRLSHTSIPKRRAKDAVAFGDRRLDPPSTPAVFALPTIRDLLLLLLHDHLLLPLLHHLRCGGRRRKMISSDLRRRDTELESVWRLQTVPVVWIRRTWCCNVRTFRYAFMPRHEKGHGETETGQRRRGIEGVRLGGMDRAPHRTDE